MKILASADWHLGAYVGPQCDNPMKRMENTIKCLDALVETARQEQPDVILVSGDVFHAAMIWSHRALKEVRLAADYMNKLSHICPVVVLYGTPNHDGEFDKEKISSPQLDVLDGMTNTEVTILSVPQLIKVHTNSGFIQVAALPGFDKGLFRAQFPGLCASEENQVFTQQLASIVQGLSAQLDPNIPSVLMAHHTVVGCDMGSGTHIFQANEVVLDAATLDNSAFDLVCLGHIHKAQRVEACSKPVYYSGSIDAFTFTDEGNDKGFWMYDIDVNRFVVSGFKETPAREFLTCRWPKDAIDSYNEVGIEAFMYEPVKNKVVRILYTCDSETEKALDKKKLERDLYAAGAYYVSEIRPESITAAVNRDRMTEKMTVETCLARYLDEKKIDVLEGRRIIVAAEPIIGEAEASSPMGATSGLFLPVEIEVRNYRSYAEEKLSFEDIFFAMVNGKNGSGKSSLFMDAITDCLYEETREKELTGWIRNGEKSGSISFTFRLGEEIYRVTRTRQRSGKATLALAKHRMVVNGVPIENLKVPTGECGFDWEDHSCERLVDTQQKIIDLLGMDCDTFQSCVLIMQDRYGKFMEASKDDRMAVLANLLGLGIYDNLSEITKGKLTDVNRGIRGLKDDITKLEESVAVEEDLHTDRAQVDCFLTVASNDLEEKRGELVKHQADLSAMDGYTRELAELEKAVASKTDAYTEKKNKKSDLEGRVIETESFLQNEQNIMDKCAELDSARLMIAALDGKVQLLNDKNLQCGKVNREFSFAQLKRKEIAISLAVINTNLQDREALEKIVIGSTVEQDLEEIEKKALNKAGIEKRIVTTKYSLQSFDKETKVNLDKRTARIDDCIKQVEIMNNSGCIDKEKANCRFLQSAKSCDRLAKELLPEMNTYRLTREQERVDFDRELQGLENELANLQYDSNLHNKLLQDIKTYRSAKDRLAKMSADAATAEALRGQDAELILKITNCDQELKLLSLEIAELEKETGKVAEQGARVRDLLRYEEQKMQLPKAKQFVESAAETIKQLEIDMQALRDEIAKADQRIEDIRKTTVGIESIRTGISTTNTIIKNLENQVSDLNRQIGNIDAKLEGIWGQKRDLVNRQSELQLAAKQAAQLTVLSEAFSQDGIPYQIIRDIVPELEAAANEILGQMTGGRMRLEFITEKVLKSNKAKEVATLEIIIIDVEHGALPYMSHSGGEKVRAALAVNFALANIKASRVGLQLGMMFVDEPPFLDADGAEAYCCVLEIQHGKYPAMRILAISHDQNMKTLFPQQLYVDVTENGSKVRRL